MSVDPVATAILFAFAVLWLAYGVGLLREWLVLRRNPIVRFIETMSAEERELIDGFVALGRDDAAEEAEADRRRLN